MPTPMGVGVSAGGQSWHGGIWGVLAAGTTASEVEADEAANLVDPTVKR